MKTLALALSLGVFGFASHAAHAAPGGKNAQQVLRIGNSQITHDEWPDVHGALTDMKIQMQRKIAGFTFHKIVKGDFNGEYVLERNGKVTAFLDPSDTTHPRYAQRGEDWAHGGAENIPAAKRIKFLVTPNRMHEHIGSNLQGEVGIQDLELALDTMKEAHRIAKQLGVVNPHIYINNQNTASIGQLHVHVFGERAPGFKYPQAVPSLIAPTN